MTLVLRQMKIALPLCCLLAAAAVYADTQTTDDKRTTAGPARTTQSGDTILATWLVQENEVEIALAELAQRKAQSPQVKEFAARMIQEHRNILNKLQKFAPDALGKTVKTEATTPATSPDQSNRPGQRPLDPPRSTDTDTDNTPGRTPDNKPGQEPSKLPPPPNQGGDQTGRLGQRPHDTDRDTAGVVGAARSLDFIALGRDLAQQCLSSARRELESKSGQDFDRCYMGSQVGAHMKAVNTVTVFQNYASGELRQALADSLPTLRNHLEHAKTLAESLYKSGTAGREVGN